MASRSRKVIILGSTGFERATPEIRIDCFLWSQLVKIRNVRDYDVVVLNLLPLSSECVRKQVEWDRFHSLLNFRCAFEILMSRGQIYVVGDPRFNIPPNASSADKQDSVEVLEVPFLEWSGVRFTWDSSPGDTVKPRYTSGYSQSFRSFISKLSNWTYSLERSRLDHETVGRYFKKSILDELDLQKVVFCQNRYHKSLAWTFRLNFQNAESGPLTFLPKVSLDENETLQLVLSCIGIESELPEPQWLGGIAVPGQEGFDNDICRIEEQLDTLKRELAIAQRKRANCRECLKLLYEKEYALEPAVRDILRRSGADVEDPEERGKEDGWIVVKSGKEKFEGVLEVKSTLRDQFADRGRKQLLDWIDRGRTLRQNEYKGIFIGNSAVERPVSERPDAFSDDWRKAAELSRICAIKSEHLYAVYVLDTHGKVDMDEFWRILFETNGVADLNEYLERLS